MRKGPRTTARLEPNPTTHSAQSGRRWTANAARNLFGSTQGAPIPRRSRRARLGVLAPMPISCALRACFLGAQCMQPRVSARSESANSCRSPASNHSHALRPGRRVQGSKRSAELIRLYAGRTTCFLHPYSREFPRGVSRPVPAARSASNHSHASPPPHNYIFHEKKGP